MIDQDVSEVAEAMGLVARTVTPLAGGHSHTTVRVTTDDGPLVMRFGGPDPAVEAAVMRRVADVVGVPAVLHVREPAAGRPGCVTLEHVRGMLLADAFATGIDPRGLGVSVGQMLARVGTVAFEHPGFFADERLTVAPVRPWSVLLPDVAAQCMRETSRLTPQQRRQWLDLCTRQAPALKSVDQQARLVHSDANPKNILVRREARAWTVAALLDWEFAHSGCPYADGANMVRFAADYPPEFVAGFRQGFGTRGQALGGILDLFALSQLLTKAPGHPVGDRVEVLVREILTGPT